MSDPARSDPPMRAADARLTARAAALRRDRIWLDAPDRAAIFDVEGAVLRLDARLAALAGGAASPGPSEPDPSTAAGAALAGFAALAAGDFPAAATIIDLLRARQDAAGRVAQDGVADATALFALLCAGHHAWTADIAFATDRWPSVRRAVQRIRSTTPADRQASVTIGAILHEVAIMAESIGETEDAAALRPPATSAPAVLHVMGAAGRAFADGHADEGFRLWRAGAGEDEDADCTTLAVLVHGILGVEPDSPRHRLVLRPRPPAAWDYLRVRNLALGEAALDIGFTREGSRFTTTFEQTRGAVPLRAALHLDLPARALRAATVDGSPARLDARPSGNRLHVPVHLSLDAVRKVSVVVE